MTADKFRRLALALPETSESAHMGHPDFRVRSKVFATLGYQGDGCAMVKLTPEEQASFTEAEPAVFAPVKGGWGRRGATIVRLKTAKEESMRRAILTAWCEVAPKRLVKQLAASLSAIESTNH
jgi:hypothetical protein